MKHKDHSQPPRLLPWLALFIFLLLFASLFLTFGIFVLLGRAGLLSWERGPASGLPVLLLYFCFASIVIGSLLSLLITYVPVRFINKIVRGMYRLADGVFLSELRPICRGQGRIWPERSTSWRKSWKTPSCCAPISSTTSPTR